MKSPFQYRSRTWRFAIKASIALGAVLSVFNHARCEAEATASNKVSRIDEMITGYQQRGYLNGAVLVADHGKIIYAKGVGEADMQTHIPNTPQTRFGIASLTKQFTAVLVLKQAVKGALRLDGTICEYLPWYRKDTGQRITVEQLLHHTAGLPPDYDRPEFSESAEACRHADPRVFAQKFCQPDLVAEPGTKWGL